MPILIFAKSFQLLPSLPFLHPQWPLNYSLAVRHPYATCLCSLAISHPCATCLCSLAVSHPCATCLCSLAISHPCLHSLYIYLHEIIKIKFMDCKAGINSLICPNWLSFFFPTAVLIWRFFFFFLSFLHKCITSQLYILTKGKGCHHINFRVYYTLSIAFTDRFLNDFIREVCKGNTVNCCVWTQNPKPFTHSFTRKRFSFNHIKPCLNFAVAHTFMHAKKQPFGAENEKQPAADFVSAHLLQLLAAAKNVWYLIHVQSFWYFTFTAIIF